MSDYTGRLKLEFDPFDIAAEPAEYYQGGNRQFLLEQLIQLSCYSSDIAIVTGPLGSGKSNLSYALKQSLDDDFITVCVQASLFMDQVQLLEAIGRGLDLDVVQLATAAEISDAIANFAGFMADKSKTVQIIIDDAHELSSEALKAILSLVERQADTAVLGEGGIKLTLLGEAQLHSTLGQTLPITKSGFELEPLTNEEAVDYIQFKLSTAGFSGKIPFDANTIDTILERSNGIPGAISTLIRDELDQSDFEPSVVTAFHVAERHLVAASLVFAALVLSLFFFGVGDDSAPENTLAVSQESSENRVQIPVDTSPGVREQQQSSNIATITDAPVTAVVDREIESEPILELPVEDPIVVEVITETADREQSADSDIPESAVVSAVVIQATEDASEIPDLKSNHPLLAYPSDSYTLQLLGSRSEINVRNFISDNGGGENYAYYKTQFQELPWYVVVYGSYPNSIAAKAAIADLPGSLSELEPWARRVSEIQQVISTNQP